MRSILFKILNAIFLRIPQNLNQLVLKTNQIIESKPQDISQRLLILKYMELVDNNQLELKLEDVGFSYYSQHEEDGILLFIFSLIETTNKKCVEICIGNGIESNTANLIINHGWEGLLFEGDLKNYNEAKSFYASNKHTTVWPPKIIREWITKENINNLIEKNVFVDEIDLLSIDIDGIDYWLWKSIAVITPRVVVIEINHLWGPEKSYTVPYSENFKAVFSEHGSDYAGASIAAMIKLSREKGYYFVGTNRFATNAFFIRKDINHPFLPERKAIEFFQHPRVKFGMEVRFENIKNLNWEEI